MSVPYVTHSRLVEKPPLPPCGQRVLVAAASAALPCSCLVYRFIHICCVNGANLQLHLGVFLLSVCAALHKCTRR